MEPSVFPTGHSHRAGPSLRGRAEGQFEDELWEGQVLKPYSSSSAGLLSVRSTLILLLGLLGGVAAGILTHLAGEHWALAVLAGLSAMSAVIIFFDAVITPERPTQ
jgi:hypothetical protein